MQCFKIKHTVGILMLCGLAGCTPPSNLGLVFESMSINGHECIFVRSDVGLDKTKLTELVNQSVDSNLSATLKAFEVPGKNVGQVIKYIARRAVIIYVQNDRAEDVATLVFDGAVVRASYVGMVSIPDLIEAGGIQEKSLDQ